MILDGWRDAFPDPATAPFGLKPWHAAFFAVGLPGLADVVVGGDVARAAPRSERGVDRARRTAPVSRRGS